MEYTRLAVAAVVVVVVVIATAAAAVFEERTAAMEYNQHTGYWKMLNLYAYHCFSGSNI